MKAKKLSPEEITAELAALPGWEVKGEKLHRELRFPDFVRAFGFMTEAAMVSERLNHHPEWFNVYGRVTIDLTTHDLGGISSRDIQWAKAADAILERSA